MTGVKIGYLRALIVDDSPVSRMGLRDLLQRAGFRHVHEAENTAAAHEKMAALRYDLVLLDWVMPGRTGLSLLDEWRGDRRYDSVAVCVVSVNNNQKQVSAALKAGALCYIIKPPTEETFREAIRKVVEWLSQRRAYAEKDND